MCITVLKTEGVRQWNGSVHHPVDGYPRDELEDIIETFEMREKPRV